jgi:flagellar basal-body rod modification protein FlgD
MAGIETNFTIGSSTESKKVEPKNDLVNKDVFLKILTAELTHQDPMNAKDNTAYISQLAQFTSLEQTQTLNNTISKLFSSQRMTEGAALIGREVDFNVGEGNTIKDVVKSAKLVGTNIYLTTENGRTFNMDKVTEVYDYIPYAVAPEVNNDNSIEAINQDSENSQANNVQGSPQDSDQVSHSNEQTQAGDVQVDQQNTEQSQA